MKPERRPGCAWSLVLLLNRATVLGLPREAVRTVRRSTAACRLKRRTVARVPQSLAAGSGRAD